MRTRGIKKQFWLNEYECELLESKSKKAGLSESEFFREVVLGYVLKEKPDNQFYEDLKIFRSLANNMNQIARKAHSLEFIDELNYRKNAEMVVNFVEELKNKYLRTIKEETK